MIIAIIIGLIALAFAAYYLAAFYQLSRAELLVKEALQDVEASMVNYYGRPHSSDDVSTNPQVPKEKKSAT